MPDPAFNADVRFYAVHVASNAPARRGTAWCWSKPFVGVKEAKAHLKEIAASGAATLIFLVQVGPGAERKVIESFTWPGTARRIIEHYEELWGMLEDQ